MADHWERIRSAFRLNLEQQRKQAKELLKAARAGDAAALSRIAAIIPEVRHQTPDRADRGARQAGLKLADAQRVIARELRFGNWTALKSHIASLDEARASMREALRAPDADFRTLHLRCGSDIRSMLVEAGFKGDFLEVSYPYCHGPITTGPDHLEREVRFIVETAGKHMNLSFADVMARGERVEHDLLGSAERYDRIVLWMEHDCFDQLVLVRCLAHYASARPPKLLELVSVNHFPGRDANGNPMRFIGLGQLPAEALRLLWDQRGAVTPEQLSLGLETWHALALEDPRPLAAIMRSGAPELPHLAVALHRLLRELPSIRNGLGMTEMLVLQVVSEGAITINGLFALMTYERDPLFFATDLFLLHVIERMLAVTEPPLSRSGAGDWTDELSITPAGLTVLAGERDWLSFAPPPRWVGGVEIRPGARNWRWDESRREAVGVSDVSPTSRPSEPAPTQNASGPPRTPRPAGRPGSDSDH